MKVVVCFETGTTIIDDQKDMCSDSPSFKLSILKWNVFVFIPFQSRVAVHIETSHLICIANQMAGFYTKCNYGLKWAKVEDIY